MERSSKVSGDSQFDVANPTRSCPVYNCPPQDAMIVGYGEGPWQLVRCRGCAMVYLPNPPTYAQLAESFEWEHSFQQERANRREGRRLYYLISDAAKAVRRRVRGGRRDKERRLLQKYVRRGRVLDVGCANGMTINAMPPEFTPFGVEISPDLARNTDVICRRRGGYVVTAPAIEGFARFADNFFDGIIMRAYLEHEVQPAQSLEGAARILRPDGPVIIKVPNFNSLNRHIRGRGWCGFRYPEHVNYFTPATLMRLIRQTGLYVEPFVSISRPPFSDNMWLIAARASSAC